MQQIAIIMPQLGESIAEATIVDFLVQEGDPVETDQDIIEVETNKATMNVTAPAAGVIRKYTAQVDESYAVGATLGYIETDRSEDAEPPQAPPAERTPLPEPAPLSSEETKPREVKPTINKLPVPADNFGASYLSPRLKARMQELALRSADLAGVAGSGAGGRVTVQDFEKFISELEKTRLSRASSMRVAVADAMCRSWTRPLATVGLSVPLEAMLQHRKQLSPRPGPTLYAIRALALALGENSTPAGRLIGRNIAHPSSIDIGFAVEAEDGVLVPILRQADREPLSSMTPRYQELMTLAKERRLTPDAMGNSVATVTNFGTFGLTWATPIPLPEQTLVLGMGAGRKKPFWDETQGAFVPRTEAYLTLSFDHRVLDGGAAGRLLAKVSALFQRPEEL